MGHGGPRRRISIWLSVIRGVVSIVFSVVFSCECSGTVSIKISWGQNSSCYTGNLNRNQQWSSFISNTVQHTFRHTLSSFSTCFNHLTYIFSKKPGRNWQWLVFGPPQLQKTYIFPKTWYNLNSKVQFWVYMFLFLLSIRYSILTPLMYHFRSPKTRWKAHREALLRKCERPTTLTLPMFHGCFVLHIFCI